MKASWWKAHKLSKEEKIWTSRHNDIFGLTIKEYMNLVQSLGCIACAQDGYHGTPAQLHHPRSEAGMSERGPDKDVIPLCVNHHLRPQNDECRNYPDGRPIISIHDDTNEFRSRYGSEESLVSHVRKSVKRILNRSCGTRRA